MLVFFLAFDSNVKVLTDLFDDLAACVMGCVTDK
jgi:hypothetical protein